jgi:uncharacterized protein YjbJ (UPF0337 family)
MEQGGGLSVLYAGSVMHLTTRQPTGDSIMGELVDKIKGNVNEALGKAKQQSDDPATRAEGADQEATGKGEQLKGKIKGALGDDI